MTATTQTITPQDLAALANQQPVMIAIYGFKMPTPSHPRYDRVMAHAHKLTPTSYMDDWRGWWRVKPDMEVSMGCSIEDGGDPYCVVITESENVQLFRYEYAGEGRAVPIFIWNFGPYESMKSFFEEHGITKIAG